MSTESKKDRAQPHVPPGIVTALHETAARLGGLDLDVVVTAAVWAYSRQDAADRRGLITEFWYRGFPELEGSGPGRRPVPFWRQIHAKIRALAASLNPAARRRDPHQG